MDKFKKEKNQATETMTDKNTKDDRVNNMQQNRKKPDSAESRAVNQEDEARQEDDKVDEEKTSGSEIEDLKESIATARQEAADNQDRFLRLSAEFENYKKRTQRQMDDYRKFSNTQLIRDLLPVVDNLERAVAAYKQGDSSVEACMVEGVEMTLNEVLNILQNYNVTQVEAEGNQFDPNYHEAVMQEESDTHPENTVIKELQKGYLLHDRLIRPSMVVVSKGRSTNQTE